MWICSVLFKSSIGQASSLHVFEGHNLMMFLSSSSLVGSSRFSWYDTGWLLTSANQYLDTGWLLTYDTGWLLTYEHVSLNSILLKTLINRKFFYSVLYLLLSRSDRTKHLTHKRKLQYITNKTTLAIFLTRFLATCQMSSECVMGALLSASRAQFY